MLIPDDLHAHFHDSALTLHRYDARGRRLTVHIEKEIGPETGIITFHNVSFVSILQNFSGDAIEARPVGELTDQTWSRYSAYPDALEPDEIAFQIVDQEGPTHLVVAKSISYELCPENQN